MKTYYWSARKCYPGEEKVGDYLCGGPIECSEPFPLDMVLRIAAGTCFRFSAGHYEPVEITVRDEKETGPVLHRRRVRVVLDVVDVPDGLQR